MNKVVLITGASSGIGKAASKYFAEHNWNVAATMRNTQYETDLVKSSNLKLYKLDVTDSVSIQTAIKSIISRSEERRVGKDCRSRRSPYH